MTDLLIKKPIGTIAPLIPFLRRSQTGPQMKSPCVFIWPNLTPKLRRQSLDSKEQRRRGEKQNISKQSKKQKQNKAGQKNSRKKQEIQRNNQKTGLLSLKWLYLITFQYLK